MNMFTRTKCPESERLNFLPRHVGNGFLRYENLVYSLMSRACEDYHGGFWDYYSLSNEGFYMAFDTEKLLHLKWPDNYFDGKMSANAASIGVNLMAQSAFAFETKSQKLCDAFHTLREYALDHKEAGLIFGFID